MKPSLALFSKASRLPLNSKKGNKDFYKGTRTGNIMVRKRIAVTNRNTGKQLYDEFGRPRSWNLKMHRIDEARVPSYIVPPGIMDCKLRPLVWVGKREDGGVEERPRPGYPGAPKMQPGGGLDGKIYKKLRSEILERRVLLDDNERNLDAAKRARSSSKS